MRKIFGASVLLGSLAAVPLGADPVVSVTSPRAGDPLLDVRIEGCEGLSGFGIVQYGALAEDLVLSDVCFDPEAGRVMGAEQFGELQLTADSAMGRRYENLASGDDTYSRNHVEFTPYEHASCTENDPETLYVITRAGNGPNGEKPSVFAMTQGYTTSVAEPFAGATSAEALVGLRAHMESNGRTELISAEAEGDFVAQFAWSGDSGTVTILNGLGYRFGDAGGALTLTPDGSGSFEISGRLEGASSRIAGQSPEHMTALNAEVVYGRGHFLGEAGSRIAGYAVVEGDMETSGEGTKRFRSMLYLSACAT